MRAVFLVPALVLAIVLVLIVARPPRPVPTWTGVGSGSIVCVPSASVLHECIAGGIDYHCIEQVDGWGQAISFTCAPVVRR